MQYKLHGMSQTPIYNVWKTMLGRCRNPNHYSYKNYGARGISVCDRWSYFENFYADMGDRPSSKHSIDRINNDGPYGPDNCQWATRNEQNTNKRLYRANVSGLSGVTKRWGKWCVQIKRHGKTHHIGMTDDFFEACCLRKSGALSYPVLEPQCPATGQAWG